MDNITKCVILIYNTTTMEFKIPVNKDFIYKAILTVLNFNLKLSDTEMDILNILLRNQIEIIDIKSRELLRKIMNKDKYVINNHIKRMKEKKILLQSEDYNKKLYINPSIKSLTQDKDITFKFIENV